MPQIKVTKILKNKKFKNSLQWLMVVGIFVFLFEKYPPRELWEVSRQARWLSLLAYGTLYFIYMWVLDAWGIGFVFARFGGHPIRLLDLMRTRAASYLIQIVNYGAGQGVLAYFLAQREKIPILRATGFIVFMSLVDLYWIISLAFMGTFFSAPVLSHVDLRRLISPIWAVSTILFVLMLLYPRFRLWAKIMEKIHFRHFLLVLALRLPMHLALITSFYYVPFFFHASLPFGHILTAMPIVIFISTLPLTPGGFGTTQIAFIGLLKNSLVTSQSANAENLLLSMSLVWSFVSIALKAIVGVLCLKLHHPETESPS